MKKINWWDPDIQTKEFDLVREVLESNYLNDGDVTDSFEEKLSEKLKCDHVIAVTSGTAALFLALYALGIREGDEVIVPDVTFIATANAVSMTGAKPVLVDIDPKTMNMSVDHLLSAINERTKAIVPVHVSGRACDIEKIIEIGRDRGINVVEDAAEAFMSQHKGKYLGTYGDAGIFSFSPNKTITTGQGGAVVTNKKGLYEKILALKDQGRPIRGTGGNDIHDTIGFNFKLTNLQSAVGLGQLQCLKKRTARMQRTYEIYADQLKDIDGISLFGFDVDKGEVPQWTDASIDNRDALCEHLEKEDIFCRKFWYPIHSQRPYKQEDSFFPESTKACKKAVWLPSSFLLQDEDVEKVCKAVNKYFKK